MVLTLLRQVIEALSAATWADKSEYFDAPIRLVPDAQTLAFLMNISAASAFDCFAAFHKSLPP
ncbi:hypothetical protein DDJ66_16475 [Klebsiella oxytoca]|nr:hypothetical protein DDJ66_16475 [Klebsiella oxytoca]